MRWALLFLLGSILGAHTPARPRMLSPIPPAQQIVVPLEPCNDDCLKKLYADGQIFSFMARYTPSQDAQLQDDYTIISDLLNPTLAIAAKPDNEAQPTQSTTQKVALLVPKEVVGKYSNTAINAILAYLALKEQNFIFRVFDSKKEDPQSLKQTYQEIVKEHFPFVIALLTQNGVQNLISQTPLSLPTIVPSAHKDQLEKLVNLPSTLIFGGIDFAQQVAMLVDLSQHKPLVLYNDDSFRGAMLGKSVQDLGAPILYQDTITFKKASAFSHELRSQIKYFKEGVVVLNTPIVKTGLLLSQIGLLARAKRPQMLLSSQINFNLALFMLTQERDRQHFYLTSAIGKINPYLEQYASILGVNLAYDWVGYTSVNSLEHMLVSTYHIAERYFSEPLQDKQIIYTNTIYTPEGLGFVPLSLPTRPPNSPVLLEEQGNNE
ncbi:type 1 periplasmic-binding domain-containing protein [Helicobacter vulpis]|uniref:transposase n=1 Tax=Helicobacter vulpis TaxID=2316076 RepID=UPI001968C1F2|nr:transposase [Helicobacter vulpis]